MTKPIETDLLALWQASQREVERLTKERDEALAAKYNGYTIIERLRAALEFSMLAIDDWLHTYAFEMCDENKARLAASRIQARGGTLSYIAEVQASNRAALGTSDAGNGEPND